MCENNGPDSKISRIDLSLEDKNQKDFMAYKSLSKAFLAIVTGSMFVPKIKPAVKTVIFGTPKKSEKTDTYGEV